MIVLIIIFLSIIASVLFYKYKGKMTPSQKRQKDLEAHQYILKRIQNLEFAKKQAEQELITGLPSWESDFNAISHKIIY